MENNENTEVITEKYFNKPSLNVRIKSMMIDTFTIVFLMYLAFIVLDSLGVESGKIRGAVLLLIILYEPVLVSLNKTIGHQIMGLRVFNYNVLVRSNEKTAISLMNSILRYIGKVILGWISLLTVHSDKYGQAIHDKIGRSVMVME